MPTVRNVFNWRSFGLLTIAGLSVGILISGPVWAKTGGVDMTEQGVRVAFSIQLTAMVAGDTKALGALLDPSFVLTHLTGYRQPKDEWLAQMREGQFIYHRMDERAVRVEMNGDRARLIAQTQTDSTVAGSRRPGGWRLQMVQEYAWHGGRWTASIA